MAGLREMVPTLLAYIKNHARYLEHNAVLLDVYNGNLLPLVDAAIAPPKFSQKYYEQIKERIIAINVLKRITDKSARAYVNAPQRIAEDKYAKDVAFYEDEMSINSKMQIADVYADLFKGYALEPFLHKGRPRLRSLPFDRFLPYSDDQVDGTSVTAFIKFMGKRTRSGNRTLSVFHVYTDDEFLSFDSEGEIVREDLDGNDGINPYGVIPFIYGNRGNDMLIPTQDTDTLSLTKIIPVLLTDLSGAIMFQCFSIVYGINVDSKDLTMSPNAFWDLKGDIAAQAGGGAPTVGTIKPEADITQVLAYIMNIFTFWLETRGIRVGSVGSADGTGGASGIAKIIDEMDATELIGKSQEAFRKDEMEFWHRLQLMQNYWVANNMLSTEHRPIIWGADFKVGTIFDAPSPGVDRMTEVTTVKLERDAGFISTRNAIEMLYPDLTPDQVDERMSTVGDSMTVMVDDEGSQPAADENTPVTEGADPLAQKTTVKDVALNGAQVESLISVVNQVSSNIIPRESGVNIIMVAFNLDRAAANAIIGEAGRSFTAQVDEPPSTPTGNA